MDEPGPPANQPLRRLRLQRVGREKRRRGRVGELQALSMAARHCRFSVLLLAAGALLLFADQGANLLVRYEEDGRTLRLAAAAAIWAASTWFWARVLLDIDHHAPLADLAAFNRWRRWLPRLLGTLAFVALLAAAWRAGCTGIAVWSGVALLVYLPAVVFRRRIANALAERLQRSPQPMLQAAGAHLRTETIGPASLPPHDTLAQALRMSHDDRQHASRNRLPWLVTVALLAVFAVLLVWSFADPVSLGRRAGAMVLFFIWAATWLPIGSAMSYFADRHGLPLLTLLALLAAVSSFWNDNHEVRHAPVSGATPARDPAARPTVAEGLLAWAAAAGATPTQRRPLVVVASAGGGIRAGYWTGTVLGELDDRSPAWRPSLFALSGVSGGSVGATVYRALLDTPLDKLPAGAGEPCRKGLRACAQQVLGEESLGALTAALLFPDLGQRFWPLPWFPSRATALEQAWERAFRDATGHDRLAAPLSALGPGPALFLNATWSDEGRRIAASNLRLDTRADAERIAFARLYDQLAVLGRDLRLSTAAHNSARFPLVSPPGSWRDRSGKLVGRLQDGGLFENYGAETALEVVELACRVLECDPAVSGGNKPLVTLIVLQITSDPSLPDNLLERSHRPPIGWGYELLSTPATYEHTRGGRGAEAAARLRAWAQAPGRHHFQLRMCMDDNAQGSEPPLGWALSLSARQRIDGFLPRGTDAPAATAPHCAHTNAVAAAALAALLEAGAAAR